MSSKISVNDGEDSSADSYNGQLLKDIKEVSRALYLNNAPQKALPSLSPTPLRSKSIARTHSSHITLSSNQGITELPKKKKKSLVPWDWKKPLKAIAHFGHRKFDVCFLLHVHSIEGLPSNLDGTKLVVQWKRKDEVMSTKPSKVMQGAAEFDETLMQRCSVYGSKHGPPRSAKYEVKLFLVYASPVDAPWIVLGKHWIDLTRILPFSLEELEGTRSTRKWNTSFKLSGLGDSAVLNLSFDYLVVTNSVCDSTSRDVMLKRVSSVPSMDHRSSTLDDEMHQVSPNLSLDLSQSIDCLYEKLSEENPESSTAIDIQNEHLGKTEVDKDLETDKQVVDDSEDTEFAFAGNGVEMFQQEGSRLEENTDPNTDSSRIEIIDIHEILKDEDETHSIDQLSVAELKSEASNFLPGHSFLGGAKSSFSSEVISESSEIISLSAMNDSTTEKEEFLEVKSSYKATKTLTKSRSLDDITESVANEFLNMLELEECSYLYTTDDEPTSPREYLLQEFEKEVMASGNFLLDLDGEAEYVSDIDEESNDFSFSSSSLVVGEKGRSQVLINRRKAKVLEELETETLMRDWDLNDSNSLCVASDGFGSPIELPEDKGDNIGPFVWTKGGGCIRSMNPLLFSKCKDASNLIMQVSIPVVLVSELGSDLLEILQSLAASGFEGFCSEVNALMPLEDIMGKTIHEVVEDARSERFGSHMWSSYVPFEALASLAIDGIELFSIEGLKIQCSMSEQDPPTSVAPKLMDQSEAFELISFSLTLDEWLMQASSGNKLTLAFRVLLRDPFRDNEPVGSSMLALIQVERSSVSSEGRIREPLEYDTDSWRITDIGLAGLRTEPDVDHLWGTRSQQQSGSRWLLASGQASSSKAIIASNPQGTRKSLDTLWSITTNRHNQEGDLSVSLPFTRNPDVTFSNEISRL